MKKLLIMLVVLLLSVTLFAQETEVEKWKNGGMGALQFSQAAMINWKAGGDNATALNFNFNYFVNYKYEKLTWQNNLDVAYGVQIKAGISQKTDDKIDFSSTFGYEAAKKWYYSGMYSFKTQMMNGYADTVRISSFMAPAYMLLSLGMKYEPSEKFYFMASPVTGKMTLVFDPIIDPADYGVATGKNTRLEFGGLAKIGFKTEIFKNVHFNTKCEFFVNYFGSPFAIDVNWDVLLGMKINDFLSANISTQLIYDRDVSTDIQFKEIFTFGLSYSF